MLKLPPYLEKSLQTPMAIFYLSASFDLWASQAAANLVRIENQT